jgi:hypothetical protein
MAANKFVRFFNFLANMGLVIRDDPPKAIDVKGREWGEATDGLVLSIRELVREEPRQVAGISVVMKNDGATVKTLQVPEWVHFYEIEGLEPTAYGRQFLKPGREGKNMVVTMKPGDAVETDLPLGTIYNLRAAGEYRVRVSCRVEEDRVLRSNEIVIRV